VPVVSDRANLRPDDLQEALGAYATVKHEQIEALVADAREKLASIPDQRVLWSLFGELLLTVRALEHEVADLRKAVKG
jgi:hypothetical protein